MSNWGIDSKAFKKGKDGVCGIIITRTYYRWCICGYDGAKICTVGLISQLGYTPDEILVPNLQEEKDNNEVDGYPTWLGDGQYVTHIYVLDLLKAVPEGRIRI